MMDPELSSSPSVGEGGGCPELVEGVREEAQETSGP